MVFTILADLHNAANRSCYGRILLSGFNQSRRASAATQTQGFDSTNSEPTKKNNTGATGVASTHDAIRLYMSTGNVSAGVFVLRGLRQ